MVELSPRVSVVIGCHRDGPLLAASLESIAAQQQAPAWECLIVANGPFQASDALQQRLANDSRFRLLHSPRRGLTEALILGCAEARGDFIARLDAGDAMAPQRLGRQLDAINRDPHCVLATSAVKVCGPRWETLWVNRGTESLAGSPTRVDHLPAAEGLAIDIPHHSSVMIRRSAYEAVSGYRSAFYFGQDWDLWYRLSSRGSFVQLPETLTCVRLFSEGLSSRHWREQREIARLSLACHVARSRGQPETQLLQHAAAIVPKSTTTSLFPWDGHRAEGAYFIAEALRRNGDRRCHQYFSEALRFGFWKPRIWIRAAQSIVLMGKETKAQGSTRT
jgi:glycosyltransferase involved in cell wall biosynthesis